MDHHDYEFLAAFGFEYPDPVWAVAVARGILIERYDISIDLAHALLQARADASELTLLETASWLCRTHTLP